MPIKGTINSRHEKTSQSSAGGQALKPDHKVARDTKGVGTGTSNSRYISTKPSGSTGDIGHAQPLKTAAAKTEQLGSDTPKGYNKRSKVYKSTKPSSGRG